MPVLIVRAKADTRFRAGIRFSREPDAYDVDEAQAELIRADEMLVVTEDKPAPAVEPADPTPSPKAKR